MFPSKVVCSARRSTREPPPPRPAPMATAAHQMAPTPSASTSSPGTAASSDPLRFPILTMLIRSGSHGVLQKHLFDRLPPSKTAKRINALGALARDRLVERTKSNRDTRTWGWLWTITDAGKRQYAKLLAERDALIAAHGQAAGRAQQPQIPPV